MSEQENLLDELKRRVAELEAENLALRQEADELDGQLHMAESELDELGRAREEDSADLEEAESHVEVGENAYL